MLPGNLKPIHHVMSSRVSPVPCLVHYLPADYTSVPAVPAVYALRTDDGSVAWTYTSDADCSSGAGFLDGLVYIPTRGSHDQYQNAFLAINATTGE